MSELHNSIHDLNRECRCLFCGETFQTDEIEFCIEIPENNGFYDQVFEDNIRKYKGCGDANAPYRIWLDWSDSEENVLKWENNIPFMVKGSLRNVTNTQASDFGFGFSLFGNTEEDDETEALQDSDGKIWRKSSIRVCPRCHMTLPKGFMSDEKIRVGLTGGQRSGKTTYMVVVTKYLQQRFHGMGNGVNLGTVTLVPECENCIDNIYEKGVDPTEAIAGQEEDPPVLPIVMHITPSDKNFASFYLILQDIPGEYMRPEPRFKEMLSSSNIKESTDILMLIDINHFIETRQKKDKAKDADKYGEYCQMDINRLFENFENLGMILDPKTISSVQISLTKLDFWKEEDPRISVTSFGKSGDNRHKGSISESRLHQVNNQMQAVLTQMYGTDYSGLINVLVERLGLKGSNILTAYSAVASKTVPNHETEFIGSTGVNFSFSLNVLEPLLNIFSCHNVLPVKRVNIFQVRE